MSRVLSSAPVYRGKVLHVNLDRVELPGGAVTDLEVIRHPGAAAVVPIHEDGSVTLIRQWRHAAGGFILEVPAGKLDHRESPESCALREVVEEAGIRAGALHPLGWIFTTPGFTDEKIHLFAATGLTAAAQALEADEVIEVVRMPLSEALRLAGTGGIRDGKSLCALFRVAQELEAGRLRLRA